MTSELILWGGGTRRTLRPLWMLHEFGLSFQHRPIRPRSGETHEPEFLALNPRHKIPVLQHGRLVLSESAAILGYIADAFPPPDGFLVPETSAERARLAEWCLFIMTELDAGSLYTMRRHGPLREIYGDAPVAVEAARNYFQHQLQQMAGRLRTSIPWLMGQQFSIADILLGSCLDWAEAYAVPLPGHLQDYRARLAARPAYRRAVEENFRE